MLTMAATVYVLGSGPAGTVAVRMFLALAPLALLAPAVHLLLASACRTTKEAHAWLSSIVFVPMVVGMFVVFFPGAVDGWASLLPVVGQQLLMSQAIAGEAWSTGSALVVAAVTVGLSAPLLLLAGRALGRDDVLDG
jgi:hypothetical protein